jgi:hypothetical protein
MESPPSSRLSFYDRGGVVIPSPIEGSGCGIAIDVPPALRASVSLKLGGFPLPMWTTETTAYSEWPPCGPGHYELFLECGDIRESRTITVIPSHFSESDFTSVVQELTEILPSKIALQLKQCGAQLGSIPTRDPAASLQDEYMKLRLAIFGTKERLGVLQFLPLLQRKCQQVLLPQLEVRDVEKLRRPVISKLPQAIAMPGNVSASNKLYQMFDVTFEQSYEAYENRLVKGYLLALRSRLSRLQTQLRSIMAPPAMAADVEALANELHLATMRATFLREVRHPSSSIRVTMVLLKNPAYRAVLEGYLALNEQSSVTLVEPAINTPLNSFPYLYQRWVGLKVLSSLLQVCTEFGYRIVSHHWVKNSGRNINIQVQNDARPAVQLACPRTGRLVTLVPWSTKGAADRNGKEPPMGVAVFFETQGRPSSVLIFNPKYWVSSKTAKVKLDKKGRAEAAERNEAPQMVTVIEPLKEDVDELVRFKKQAKVAAGASEIVYGALLYAGPRKQLAPDVEALPAHPRDHEGFQNAICEVLRRYMV